MSQLKIFKNVINYINLAVKPNQHDYEKQHCLRGKNMAIGKLWPN
jgi:hypothetical protein